MGYRQNTGIFDADAMVTYVIESDEFVEAVTASRAGEIEGLIEEAIREVDIENLVDQAIPDISDLEKRIEELEGESEAKNEDYIALLKQFEDFQKLVFATITKIEENNKKSHISIFAELNRIREDIYDRVSKNKLGFWAMIERVILGN